MPVKNDSRSLFVASALRGALLASIAATVFGAGIALAEDDGMSRQQAIILERIKPIGTVNVARADAVPAAPRGGEEVVGAVCNACHATGALQAPKIGDEAAWTARKAANGGLDGLLQSAIAGKGAMPPRGGGNASDEELRAAIEFMLQKSGVSAGEVATAEAPAAAEPAPGPMAAVSNMMGAAVGSMTEAVGQVATEVAEVMAPPEATPAASAVDLEKGKAVYDSACFACHATGAAGAPLLGDSATWKPRIDQGMDALIFSALNGKGAMPPRGGRMDLSDDDIVASIGYMVSKSR